MLDHYNSTVTTTDLLGRGVCGFATPDIHNLREKYKKQYIVRLKKKVYFCSVSYQAASCSKPRRVYVRSTREVGELLFNH